MNSRIKGSEEARIGARWEEGSHTKRMHRAGEQQEILGASEFPAGIYLYTLQTEGYSDVKKMLR